MARIYFWHVSVIANCQSTKAINKAHVGLLEIAFHTKVAFPFQHNMAYNVFGTEIYEVMHMIKQPCATYRLKNVIPS